MANPFALPDGDLEPSPYFVLVIEIGRDPGRTAIWSVARMIRSVLTFDSRAVTEYCRKRAWPFSISVVHAMCPHEATSCCAVGGLECVVLLLCHSGIMVF